MATRIIKAGGSSIEFQLAPEPLHIEDLDADLDAIFSGIDNSNIATGANIATSKLATDGGITTGMLANGAVTGSKLATGAVTGPSIFPGSTTASGQSNVPSVPGSNDVIERDVATMSAITTRGGLVFFFGAIPWSVALTDTLGHTVTMKLYRDATLIMEQNFSVQAGIASPSIIPLPTPGWIDRPAAGTYVYKLSVVTDNPTCSVLVNTFGGFSCIEMA